MNNKKLLAATLISTALFAGSAANAEDVSTWEGLRTNLGTGTESEATIVDTITGGTVINASAVSHTINLNNQTISGGNGLNFTGGSLTINNGGTISGVSNSGKGAITATSTPVTFNVNNIVFSNNTSTQHGAAFYYKDQAATAGAVFNANEITFSGNTSGTSEGTSASSGGAILNTGGSISLLGTTNTFTGNKVIGTDVSEKLYKRGGGAIANQSYDNESTHDPINATMIIGKNDGSSTNTFSGNQSSMNGGAIMNRAVDTDGNATLTINGNTTFSNNTATKNGGAIYNAQQAGRTATVNLNNGTYTFTNNSAGGDGGAIYNTSDLTLNNTTFSENSARYGGAVENSGTITATDVTFANNTGRSGGAIDFDYGTVTINGESTFSGNEVTNLGGAVYSGGTLVLNGTTFSGNKTTGGDAGAVLASGDTTITNATFIGNTAAGWGGAIANGGTLSIIGSTFEGNKAQWAGAIEDYLDSTGGVSVTGTIQDTVFKNNSADEIGAVGLYTKNAISNFSNVQFIANKATSSAADSDGSGAIFIGAEAKVNIVDTVFDSNTSAAVAGAIGMRSFNLGANSAAALDIDKSTFKNNSAVTNGGAINNYLYNDANNDGYVKITNSTFESNSAANGGAIYNHIGKIGDKLINPNSVSAEDVQKADTDPSRIQVGKMHIVDSSFRGNKASSKGGAIYNEGILSIIAENKNIEFSDNMVGENENDIYNVGTLNLNVGMDRILTLNGGIDGAIESVATNIVNIDHGTGAGVVEADSITNQTVNVASAVELVLMNGTETGSNLEGSTVTINNGAIINTIDDKINDYTGKVILGNGAVVKAEARLVSGGTSKVDKFTATGDVNVNNITILNDFESGGQYADLEIATGATSVVANNVKAYTTGGAYKVEGSGVAGAGSIRITKTGNGGLNIAVKETSETVPETITYNLTAGEKYYSVANTDDTTVEKANFTIVGNDNKITADNGTTTTKGIIVATDSVVKIQEATLAEFAHEDGAIYNKGILDLDQVEIGSDNALGLKNEGASGDLAEATLANRTQVDSVTNNQYGIVNLTSGASVNKIANEGTFNIEAVEDLTTAITDAVGAPATGITNVTVAAGDSVNWTTTGITQKELNFDGAGHLELTGGPVVANITNSMTGNTLVINTAVTGTLENSPATAHAELATGASISGLITNDGILDITAANYNITNGIAQADVTDGTLNIGGGANNANVTIASGKSIAQNELNILSNGTLTTGWSQLAIHNNTINNDGNLIITDNGAGAFDKSIAGAGTTAVNIGSANTMTYNMDSTSIYNAIKLASGTLAARNGASGDITLNGVIGGDGTLNVADNKVGAINLGAVDLTNSNLNIAMDTNITAGTSDVLAATSVSGSKKINVSDLNLITSGTTFDINVADASTKDYVDMSNTAISGAATSLMFTYDKTTGNIKSGATPITTLAEAIASNVDTKMFSMAADQAINPSHVAGGQVLNGTSLSVTGNGNHISAVAEGYDGISVGSGKTLSIANAVIGKDATPGIYGFGTAINNTGTLNLSGVTMIGNVKDVNNTYIANLSGNNTMQTFDNSYTINITDGNTTITKLTNNGNILGEGILSLNGASTNSGTIGTLIGVDNGGILTNAGENASISGNIIAESGSQIINDALISGEITAKGGSQITNSSVISGDIEALTGSTTTNSGTITGGIENAGALANSGTITGIVHNKTADSSITNSGALNGDVVNEGTLKNSGNGMISGDVANTGTLENSGNATITGDINNAGGTVKVKGGSIEGDISGAGGTVNVTGDALVSGAMTNQALNVATNATLETNESTLNGTGNNVTLANGSTLDIANGSTAAVTNAINIAAGVTANTEIDVNVQNGTSDSFDTSHIDADGYVQLTDVEISNLNKIVNNNTDINLAATTGLGDKLKISDALQGQKFQAMTPIRIMEATISQNGMMNIHPSSDHNDWSSYNPAVLASPVAAQLGGYLVQLNSYDQAFRNMDMYMLMTRKERQALKFRNKMASMQNVSYDPTNQVTDSAAGWVRPYASFENVALHNGPKVSNVMYGTFIGGESELKDLGHGWDGMWGAYVGYNGSHQAYSGVGIYQNGGSLGLVGMAYKDNFFVGGTINTGAGVADASTMYGSETMTMLMAGIAAKTGYNWELADGKFIIQPSLLAAYSFVNTFDYTNAAGVRIDSDPLHAITIEPGLKLIGNLKNGWQPYIGASVVINIMDRTRFMANDISLPNLGINPYAKYGLGVRKTWGDRFSGFLQAFFTSGGRDGVGFQGGFRWNIGKAGSGHISRDAQTPQLKQTTISLNNKKAAK